MAQKQANCWLLLEEARTLGLPLQDYTNAKEMFNHAEWGVGFDIIVGQLYELGIKITESFYKKVEVVALSLNLTREEYSFLNELIFSY
ncbi:hypothetical protein SAMN00120144_2515 [Hymenobacter roseosalivarius DSM 11622]|uniref:Uncharacterized protein n=1 Tax=Hymenobacter roseosalivarius DSM 11622 TaxID=645990 RepID=A0A1W1W399_9BACT|nr:hypothetical protein [Hymenobacter roseosalivarius]SMC00097.1 hypothetical protein SAMN00120144_2515 [Hymenobacter roseosalivarius DSM 11622]